MIIRTIFRGGKNTPVNTFFLSLTLVVVGLIEYLPITWVYQKTKQALGVDFAQISLTFTTVILLGLVLTGMVLAYFIDNAIRKRRFIFRSPRCWGWVEPLIRVWGFELVDEHQESHVTSKADNTLMPDEVSTILNKPRRGGRRPTYSIDRWRRIVLKWENRDTLRDAMTLADLLAEEFGTHPDGSPRMTEQTYYCWRDKVLDEIKNEVEANNSSR